MDMSLSKLQEMMDREPWYAACSPWGCKELDTTEQLNNQILASQHLTVKRKDSSGAKLKFGNCC